MIIPLYGDKHGRYSCKVSSPGVRGHYRQAHHDFGSDDVLWPDQLHTVGRRVGEGGNTSHLHSFQLSCSESKGVS